MFLLSDGCDWLTGETIAMDGAQALGDRRHFLRIAQMGRRRMESRARGDRARMRVTARRAAEAHNGWERVGRCFSPMEPRVL